MLTQLLRQPGAWSNIDNGFGAGYLASMIQSYGGKNDETLYLECNMGAAGDMLMAALLELIPPTGRPSWRR